MARITRRTQLIVGLALLIIMAWLTCRYVVLPVVFAYRFSRAVSADMAVGREYMDSLTGTDIQVWIERTKKLLSEYEPGAEPIGVYVVGAKPIPPDLSELRIIRIDMSGNWVRYLWVGGIDHTELEVRRITNDCFIVVAHYDDEKSRVIWPRE